MAEFFSTNLKYLREQNGLSQNKLAEKIGVNQTTIARWEDDNRVPTIDNAIDVSEALNIPLPDLLGIDLRLSRPEAQKKTVKFGDVEVTLSKNGKITDKDILELNQFLMQERILDENNTPEQT